MSDDAVYFHIDPSHSAKVATQLFGGTACILFLVCDRLSSYKTMAHELGGAVILCWCWAHQRRDFIHGAAGQAGLTHWCQTWIERIASICKLNEARLGHCDPALERQTAAFAQAQAALEAEVERLFADAEQDLAVLPAGALETKALRSLLNPRFLILPWIVIPNLGSHILSLVRRQLPGDWTERYNVTPVLIETFVETPRFTEVHNQARLDRPVSFSDTGCARRSRRHGAPQPGSGA